MVMSAIDTRIGFVVAGEQTPNQRAVFEWLDTETEWDAGRITFEDAVSGAVNLELFDALWWHEDRPVQSPDAYTAAQLVDRITNFRSAGGGLVLTGHALGAVDDLGIDELAPDRAVESNHEQAGGFLVKSIYRNHPLFEGIQSLQVYTDGPGEAGGVRYEESLPVDGEVFAGNLVDGTPLPHEMPLVVWQDEPGVVVGIGQHVRFTTESQYEDARSRLLDNALAVATSTPTYEFPQASHLNTAAQFKHIRERVDRDPNRPAYHFSPPANWLNDPNGLIYWNGQYHLFYNHNPAGPFHGTIHSIPNFKGHAVSDDLVHWTDRPIGLSPAPEGPDDYGTWTGCIVNDDKTPTFVYTGATDGDRYETAGRQRPCLAFGSDNLETWTKYADNPVIADPPASLDLVSNDWNEEFRDHCVWQDEGVWYQIIGTGIEGEGGTALLYRSSDLREWEYLNPILVGDREETGRIWECPELFDIGGKHLLHVSSHSTVYAFLGDFDGRKFTPERRTRLDYGDFYAPQSFIDEYGRRILLGWITEQQHPRGNWDAGWGGMVSVPRVLSLDSDDLRIKPLPELEQLRGVHHGVYDRVVAPINKDCDRRTECRWTSDDLAVGPFSAGDALELDAELDADDADEIGLVLRRTPDGTEQTRIGYRPDNEVVAIVRSESSLREDVRKTTLTVPADQNDETVSLRVFLDRSVIEVFVDERRCLTSRIYPTWGDATGLGAYAIGGEGTLKHLNCWSMDSIWDSA
ncbi:GH32 C-terminal domain-containing protein [Haloprofundus salilacus]|uniref:GH32 C-terminal domain-containing protein n=1 Tax=Haloprofundus salilacus TaxID=2876190 RepID=UPI001CCBE27D|nr:GH32 C-terminal domain-containing protein [Haloprofundus salilacus]